MARGINPSTTTKPPTPHLAKSTSLHSFNNRSLSKHTSTHKPSRPTTSMHS